MKKVFTLIVFGIVLPMLFMGLSPRPGGKSNTTQQYVVIAWNDLGMHCANLDFATMCILPPYNNQMAQVIQKGSPSALPVVMSGQDGVYLTYEIPGNSQSATKTNFWNYAQQLFGVTLPANVGLTGNGMTGVMAPDPTNFFMAAGIPITAFTDATPTVADPYQLTQVKAYSAGNQLLGSTQSVIPVSHEINCVSSGCHASELAILQKHDQVPGFNINNRPIFCATCHSDNALGMPGQPGVPPFSQVIHEKHGEFIKTNTNTDCYKCHPGPNTQCWRDVMHDSPGGITKCQDCHGSVSQVGHSIDSGREPWLEEPSCGAASCHGPNYAEEPGKLFRNSKGHGGLFCSACHGSPHAIVPTGNARDNVQNIAIQGHSGTLSDCSVCHGYMPSGPGPHGLLNTSVQNVTVPAAQTSCYNATGFLSVAGNGTTVAIQSGGSATFIAGHRVNFFPGASVSPGGYLHGYITTTNQYCGTPAAPQPTFGTGDDKQVGAGVFRVWPNPTTGIFMIEKTGGDQADPIVADIFMADGVNVFSREFKGKRINEVNLSEYPAGVYFIRVHSGNSGTSAKIVLQR